MRRFFLAGIFLCTLPIIGGNLLLGQSTFEIDSIAPGRRTLNIWVKVNDKRTAEGLTANTVKVFDQIKGDSDSQPDSLKIDFVRVDSQDSSLVEIQLHHSSEKLIGMRREIHVKWGQNEDREFYKFGTTNVPVYIRKDEDAEVNTLLNVLVVGLLFVSVLLIILGQLLPVLRRMSFRRKYVIPYEKVKIPNVVKKDPISGIPFEDDELVVNKCRRLTSLDSWKHNGNQCPDYPECMYAGDPCKDGEVSLSEERFFDQKGPYKFLNWIWFGSLGGMSAWIIWAALNYSFSWQGVSLSALAEIDFRNLMSEITLGGGLGLGLTFWMAQVEERSQIRARGALRVFLRSIIGIISGGLVFGLGYIFEESLASGEESLLIRYFFNLPTWLLFGAVIGLILSFWSTVNTGRGILAGILASILSYSLYFLGLFFLPESEWARMISLILMGMILGGMIVSVIYQKGDFELEIISPSKFQTIIPINKWLTSGINVIIGTSSNANIYVQWNDNQVSPEHAVLSYSNRQVFLQPLAETLVNGHMVPVPRKMELHDGDIIQLGRGGSTKMRFLERGSDHQIDFESMKKQGKKWAEEPPNNESAPPSPTRPNPNIKISRRGG